MMHVRILLLSIVMVMYTANGQIFTRRRQFNVQQEQEQQELPAQVEAEERPASMATFDRIFETFRTINEILQALSAIRARLNSDSSQLAGITSFSTTAQ